MLQLARVALRSPTQSVAIMPGAKKVRFASPPVLSPMSHDAPMSHDELDDYDFFVENRCFDDAGDEE